VHAVLLDLEYPDGTVECGAQDSDVAGSLELACAQVIPQFVPIELSDADIDSVCAEFATNSITRLGEEGALAALTGEDPAGGEVLFSILEEAIAGVGG